ncbi:putative alkaline phosphatase [Plesiocystis pacifica SIR-1]|uniref:Putative alkaline phosphatase n=2 Tax=Plesiocystis pacifica TaxID=191768 RepID=A6FZS4_9BACT|nr:putative alkaline phosphatase [Plesiocystis pacifica SIR-1]
MLGAATLIPSFTACTLTVSSGDDEVGEDTETDTESESDTTGGGDGLPEYAWEGEPGPETIFSHGVASGDPLADSVILWTRVSPASPDEAVRLFFEVAVDPDFELRVAADYIDVEATSARDHTMKIDVDGLDPASTYYYRFYAQGRVSPVGRTRTAPAGASEHLRFALASCSSLAHGYFHPYRELSTRADLDAILHVGDYIYEYGTGYYGEVREYDPPHEIVTLSDYRRRYAQYRADAALQEAHRQHPFIVTWDDHEIANNGWLGGAENHTDDEGSWAARKAAGTQAYFEWLPLREGAPGRVYRALSYGELVDLIVLDTRYEGREEQVAPASDGVEAFYEDRQLLGVEQESWLLDRLASSTGQWKILANQIIMGQLIITPGDEGELNGFLLPDIWDGYDAARRRIFQHLIDNAIDDVVVLAGDLHISFANELTIDPYDGYDPETGEGAVAVEFATPGISSPASGFDAGTLALLQSLNPHNRYVAAGDNGYVTIDVTPARLQADFWMFPPQLRESPEFAPGSFAAGWSVASGTARLSEAGEPAPAKADPPPLAP